MTTQQEEKLKKLLEKKQQLENRIKLEQNRLQKKERQDDTRRKILAGALMLEEYKNKTEELKAKMDKYLSRENDRELFGLPSKQSSHQPQE